MIRKQTGKFSKTVLFNIGLAVVAMSQELLAVVDIFPASFTLYARPVLLVVSIIGNTVLRHMTSTPMGQPIKPMQDPAPLEPK
jgi:hypothetical protein